MPTIFELLVANVAFGTTETSFQPYGLSGEPGQGDNWENYCGDSYVAHVKCTSTSTLDGASEEFEVEGRPSAMPTGLPSSEPTPVPSYVGIRVAYPDGRDLECVHGSIRPSRRDRVPSLSMSYRPSLPENEDDVARISRSSLRLTTLRSD